MTDHILAARLDRLLSEPLESIRLRQKQTLLQVLGDFDQPFVLFGAGHLGRKAARALLELGLVPQAFIDNNPALWGTHVQGVEVLSPGQLASREADQLPAIITTIWCGEASDRMVERLAPLRELGFERIALFGHLAWYMPERFLPGNREKLHRFQYLPFGAGPRTCIGATFALQEAVIALAVLMKRYRFDMTEDTNPWPIQRLTTQPRGGLPLRVTAR